MKRKKFIAATSPMYEALFGEDANRECLRGNSSEAATGVDSTLTTASASVAEMFQMRESDVSTSGQLLTSVSVASE